MPSQLYNWYCVAHSLLQVANNVAQIRTRQIGVRCLGKQRATSRSTTKSPVQPRNIVLNATSPQHDSLTGSVPPLVRPTGLAPDTHAADTNSRYEFDAAVSTPKSIFAAEEPIKESAILREHPTSAEDVAPDEQATPTSFGNKSDQNPSHPNQRLVSSSVPSSKVARLFHYGGLAASLAAGTAASYFRPGTSRVLSDANLHKLVVKLSRMRGAALKLGQFMSIQDTNTLPPELDEVFRRVQHSANYMPNWQMEKVLTQNLGPEYKTLFASFEPIPFAAASIGQVHAAKLNGALSPTGKEENVVVKIQFPGIRDSIQSDLGILKSLLMASFLLPRGLFLDQTIAVMSDELAEECDYLREASAINTFREALSSEHDSSRYQVPWVSEHSTREVLIMERLHGIGLGDVSIDNTSQEVRDELATRVVELCLRELFEWQAMQTDPNWSNFMWNGANGKLQLLDFGATRFYGKAFIDQWLGLLQAAINEDEAVCKEFSLQLGYLTGKESDEMLRAHIQSMVLLASPFRHQAEQPYAFDASSEWSRITQKIRATIPTMLKERLTPPPRQTYSLNRKLSGAFLLASRLHAHVDCRKLWLTFGKQYRQ